MSSEPSPYSLIRLAIECHAGYRGEAEPRYLTLGDKRRGVRDVVDRWYAPEYRYFKLLADDGAVYIVRNDVAGEDWELVMYEVADDRAAPAPPIRTAGARVHRFYNHPRKRR